MELDTKSEIAELKKQMLRQRRLLHLTMFGWVVGGSVLLLGALPVPPLQDLRVKRLAVVDANGVERLILNADNMHANLHGHSMKRQSPVAGVILQNAKGDEMGGMMTDGNGAAAVALDSYSN